MDSVIDQIPLFPQIGQLFLREVIVCHAAFFHDTARGVVPCEEGSIDGMKAFFGKQIIQKSPNRFGGVAVSPIARPDPIADLAGALFFVKKIDNPDMPNVIKIRA